MQTNFVWCERVSNIDSVYQFLGQNGASGLLTVHVLTGCDTTGKFNGISKKRLDIALFKSPAQSRALNIIR